MTDNLHAKLTSILRGAGIQVALSEDETAHYPYVTFELPTETRYTKDGPYKVVGNLTIRSVSDDFDEADALRVSIQSAIATGFEGLTPVPGEEPAEDADGPVTEYPDDPDQPVETGPEPEPEESDEPDPVDPIPVDPDDPVEPEPVDPEPADPEDEEQDDPYTYTARLTDVRKDCMDGIWVIEQDYILNQYE